MKEDGFHKGLSTERNRSEVAYTVNCKPGFLSELYSVFFQPKLGTIEQVMVSLDSKIPVNRQPIRTVLIAYS